MSGLFGLPDPNARGTVILDLQMVLLVIDSVHTYLLTFHDDFADHLVTTLATSSFVAAAKGGLTQGVRGARILDLPPIP